MYQQQSNLGMHRIVMQKNFKRQSNYVSLDGLLPLIYIHIIYIFMYNIYKLAVDNRLKLFLICT